MAQRFTLKIGDHAPGFTLRSASGELVSLSDYIGRSEIILFFYPKAYSPFCTAEACSFRENDQVFHDAGASVIGISNDSPSALKRFAGLFKLPFVLLSDPDGKVRHAYGVSRTFGLFPGRVTFLIDREGYIRHIYSSQFQPTRHVAEMLGALQDLRGKNPSRS